MMGEATALCDTIALLSEGIIVEKGASRERCRKYNHQKRIKLHLSSGEDKEFPYEKSLQMRYSDCLKQAVLKPYAHRNRF